MYAVFESGGKQYKVSKGDVVSVEKLEAEPGKAVSFDALVVSNGTDVLIGTPVVDGAKVRAKVLEHGKERKIIVFKYKPKIHERKKQGHRQPFTKLEITAIDTKGAMAQESGEETAKPAAEKKAPAAKPAAAAAPKAAQKPAAAKSTAAKTQTVKPAASKPAAKPQSKASAAKPAAAKPAAAKPAAEKKPAAKKPAGKETK